MSQVSAFGAVRPDAPLQAVKIERRDLGADDVAIDISHCGICHSDLHFVRGEWGDTPSPAVPGHEIVGVVRAVGANVKKYKPGDRVGVGCMVDSCRQCDACAEGEEQFCTAQIQTYAGVEKQTGLPTYGGYSKSIIVTQDFVLRIPDGLSSEHAAPLLCAGITTYSPLRHWGAGPGKKVGVVGLGGLGHMAVKLAKAMGAHVVVFTTSAGKIADAKALGADEVVLSKDAAQMGAHANSFHLIINSVSAAHDLEAFTQLLRRNGTLCLLGAPPITESHRWPGVFTMLMGRRSIAGSPIGGIRETQEMLDFCAAKGVNPEIEVIASDVINAAYERLVKGDIRYRFVIDMSTLA
ncbi:MAG TPA: NAD(P)-dependent alcohol dehydrogenase [Terricaulis sp.]|nr:NAD(P)-dependent alcohol dehydrogenase [Terricaulis sp.]HRP11622.1 NAD(P)-dependent alcohol dehydrogenase [Terricaulis sp.]